MKSRVHPKYKTKYRVKNWASYDRALVQRGDVTVWLSPGGIAAWKPPSTSKRGGQLKYSGLAIETALTLLLAFPLPLHKAEGFLKSLFGVMGRDLSVPDHITISRRGQHLDIKPRRGPNDEAMARGAAAVIPPRSGATVAGTNVTPCLARDRTVARVKEVGRRQWKKESGDHHQGTVENAFFRYKSIIGERLRARHP